MSPGVTPGLFADITVGGEHYRIVSGDMNECFASIETLVLEVEGVIGTASKDAFYEVVATELQR